MRRFGVLCASAILMLSVSACGDDDSNDDNKAGDPATPTSSESIETPTASPSESDAPTDDPTETDPPTDMDPVKEEFCTKATAEGFTTGGFEEIKGWGEAMSQATVPDDLSAEAKAGMELLITMIDEAKTEDDLNKAGNNLKPADQAELSAFLRYVQTDCQ